MLNEIEKELIMEIIKYDTDQKKIKNIINENKINWMNILGFISYHRIAGFIYEKVNEINIRLLEFPVFFSSYMINQSQSFRNNAQLLEIQKIADEFEKNNIKYVFLKGAMLNHFVFKTGSRASNDIDILVNKDSLNNSIKILNKLGYIQGIYNYKKETIEKFSQEEIDFNIKSRGETCPFVKIMNSPALKTIDIDLNFSLDWSPNYSQELINTLLDNRIKMSSLNNINLYFPSIYDNIIELCIHLYKDISILDIVKKRKVFDLYKFIDIYYLIKNHYDNIDFKILEEEIGLFNAEKYIYIAFKYLSELFDDFNTKEIKELLSNISNKISNHDFIDTIFDQYDNNKKIKTTLNLKDRIFEYDIINHYEEV